MFTGIVESLGLVSSIESEGSNKNFWIESDISNVLKIDQSVSHNGVCLTVISVSENEHCVTAIAETLEKSNLNDLVEGGIVNLERSVTLNQPLDGHLVQGHVDDVCSCLEVKEMDGSWLYTFDLKPKWKNFVVNKGSVCLNGVSLTIADLQNDAFFVAIIPYTYNHTNFKEIQPGDKVNVEFDILGKYVNRMMGK